LFKVDSRMGLLIGGGLAVFIVVTEGVRRLIRRAKTA